MKGILTLALFALSGAAAQAQMIGVASGSSNLYDIDLATGNAAYRTTVTSGSGLVVSFTGAAFLGSELWATDVLDFGRGIFTMGTIDTTTGVYTARDDQAGSANWHGLAADQANKVLYSIDLNAGNQLVRYDPASGAETYVGAAGIDGRGMAFDNGTGTLYATGWDGVNCLLYTVDTSTGASTLVGDTGTDNYFTGLEFDESSRTLYLNDGNNNLFYKVDTSSGLATLIGPNGGAYTIDGLAMQSIPAPGSLALLGLSGLCAARRRR